MRINNGFIIVGVDAGYGNMKTANTIFPTGLAVMDTKPYFDGDIMHSMAGGTASARATRRSTRTRRLTRTSTSSRWLPLPLSFRTKDITEANIYLAIRLPTTWTVRQRNAYREYMMRNKDVEFVFNDIDYHLHFVQCSVFRRAMQRWCP